MTIKMLKIFSAVIIILSAVSGIYAENRIAVVKSRFDNIELVLDTYHINYDLIDFRDMADPATFDKYDSIFY